MNTRKTSDAKRDRQLRLQAIHLIGILPDDPVEARRILTYAMDLFDQYVEDRPRRLNVVEKDSG